MLRQKDKELEAKERQLDKFQSEFKKMQKFMEFKPTSSPIGHTGRDKEHLKEKRKGYPKEKRPSPPYFLRCKHPRKSSRKKPNEKKDQVVGIKFLQMELNQRKHEMKITNERLNHVYGD